MGLAAVTWRYCVAQAPKCGAPGSPGRVHFGSGPAALDPIGPVGTRVEAILRPLPRIPVHPPVSSVLPQRDTLFPISAAIFCQARYISRMLVLTQQVSLRGRMTRSTQILQC